jgi:hypothetical protein
VPVLDPSTLFELIAASLEAKDVQLSGAFRKDWLQSVRNAPSPSIDDLRRTTELYAKCVASAVVTFDKYGLVKPVPKAFKL